MLTLSYSGLAGTGNASVQKLQESLKALAAVTGKPLIDPGNADGVVGPRTANAVIASMGLLMQHLGSTGGILQAGLAIYSIADSARTYSLITQYASQLDQAARSAAVVWAQQHGAPTTTTPVPTGPTTPFPTAGGMPWWKTWWGIGGIAVGGLALVALIAAPRRAPAARAA